MDSIVIDGIKNSGEVEEFRKYSNFFLFSIDACVEKHWERVREKYEGNQESFFADDERDHNENIDYGQQVVLQRHFSSSFFRQPDDNFF